MASRLIEKDEYKKPCAAGLFITCYLADTGINAAR
jgi:hypothetical protein